MCKKSRFEAVIVKRIVDETGYVHAYDKNDRLCWDNENAERVILIDDLRPYVDGLYKGQLGWTVSGSTDGYTSIDVQFDSGPCITVRTYLLDRVVPENADAISRAIIEDCRGTIFDADPESAEGARATSMSKLYGTHIDYDNLVQMGEGPHEVYAYTFPSLVELAHFKHQAFYPIKIGFTTDKDFGAFSRVRMQILDGTAYPEKIRLLVIVRCRNGRAIEAAVHQHLRKQNRKLNSAVGNEWFLSNVDELHRIFDMCCTQDECKLTGEYRNDD